MAPATMITIIPRSLLREILKEFAGECTTKKLECGVVCRLIGRNCQAATNVEDMSGSFTAGTLEKVLGLVCGRHLYDIGAHVGLVVLLAIASFGFEAASGCELLGNYFLNDYFELCKKKLEEKCGRTLNAQIKFEAFAKVPPEADVVFTFNAVFEQAVQHLIMQEVKNAEHVKYFICTRSRAFENFTQVVAALDNTFELVEIVKGSMTGSGQQHQIFVLRRTM